MQQKIAYLIHESSRRFLSKLSYGLLQLCSSNISSNARWLIRNSASSPGDFNVFLSDLDFSLICPEENLRDLEKLKSRYFFLKKFIPWIGELEIYSEAEVARISELKKVCGAEYEMLRRFRKINWMSINLRRNPSFLGKIKYQRAINKNLTLLKAQSAQLALDKIFSQYAATTSAFSEPIYHPYLSCWLNVDTADGIYPAYRLSPEKVPLLFAMLPPSSCLMPDSLRTEIENLRKSEQIILIWKHLNELEWLIVRAVNRGAPKPNEELLNWESILRGEVEESIDSKINPDILSKISLLLESGKAINLRVVSNSMRPLILPEDRIKIQSASFESLRRFDIILFHVHGRLTCHYVIRKASEFGYLETVGLDSAKIDAPVLASNYIGKVVSHRISAAQRLRQIARHWRYFLPQ